MTSGNWGCIRPFGIDNGELESLSRSECFCLGYELCSIDQKISTGKAFSDTIHIDNLKRVEKWLLRQDRSFDFTYPSDDISEGWVYLSVEARS